MTVIDDHLRKFDAAQRAALEAVCTTIRSALPAAEETISYGMPTFKIAGVAVVGLDGFVKHNSLFPYSGGVLSEFADALSAYPQTKGSIHFPLDRAFPAPLLKRLLKTRIREINAAYPKKSGEMKEFYDNGQLKASGRMKGDTLTGAWEWFRRDGSLMRTGAFRAGQQVGEWTTYDSSGAVVKVTTFR